MDKKYFWFLVFQPKLETPKSRQISDELDKLSSNPGSNSEAGGSEGGEASWQMILMILWDINQKKKLF